MHSAIDQLSAKLAFRWKRFKARFLVKQVLFSESDFSARESFRADYSRIAITLLKHVDGESVIDIGCANAFFHDPLVEAGFSYRGLEVSPEVLPHLPAEIQPKITISDFIRASGRYDGAICVEVAEHIPPYRSKHLVNTLCRLSEHWIFFTAAGPGQSGIGHINCRPHEDWVAWFVENDWHVDETATADIRDQLAGLKDVYWLHYNAFLLRRNLGNG